MPTKSALRQTHSYLIGVIHSHPTAPWGEVIHLPLLLLASISWGKHDPELARLVNNKVCCPVLKEYNIQPDMWDRSPVSLDASLQTANTHLHSSPDRQKRVFQLLWVVSTREWGEGCFYTGLAHGKLCRPRCSWWSHSDSSTSSLA